MWKWSTFNYEKYIFMRRTKKIFWITDEVKSQFSIKDYDGDMDLVHDYEHSKYVERVGSGYKYY